MDGTVMLLCQRIQFTNVPIQQSEHYKENEIDEGYISGQLSYVDHGEFHGNVAFSPKNEN